MKRIVTMLFTGNKKSIMKKAAALVLLLFLCHYATYSQKVDSIKVEQSGDFIKVGYKILDSRQGQVFRVKVLCSINGGLFSELRSVSGDTGDQVPGGKPEYWALWDVLKDVDEVKSVDFVVRAELVSDINNTSRSKKNEKIFNFQGSVQLPGPTFGLRTGLMGKFGVSAAFSRGMAVMLKETGYTDEPVFNRFSLDFTSRIADNDGIELHLLTGVTVGNSIIREEYSMSTGASTTDTYYKKALTPGPELGFSLCTKRLIFTLSGTKLLTGMTEEGESISKNTYIVFAAGFRL